MCRGTTIASRPDRALPLRRILKLKVAIAALLWTLLISALHVQLNVGWGKLVDNVQVAIGAKRGEMVVGFLPVT